MFVRLHVGPPHRAMKIVSNCRTDLYSCKCCESTTCFGRAMDDCPCCEMNLCEDSNRVTHCQGKACVKEGQYQKGSCEVSSRPPLIICFLRLFSAGCGMRDYCSDCYFLNQYSIDDRYFCGDCIWSHCDGEGCSELYCVFCPENSGEE